MKVNKYESKQIFFEKESQVLNLIFTLLLSCEHVELYIFFHIDIFLCALFYDFFLLKVRLPRSFSDSSASDATLLFAFLVHFLLLFFTLFKLFDLFFLLDTHLEIFVESVFNLFHFWPSILLISIDFRHPKLVNWFNF